MHGVPEPVTIEMKVPTALGLELAGAWIQEESCSVAHRPA